MAVPRSVRSVFVLSDGETFTFADRVMSWTSLERAEPEDEPSAMDKLSLSSHEHTKVETRDPSLPDHRIM